MRPAATAGLRQHHTASVPALLAGFASIYIIWGSTYLAIRFVVETMPPIMTAGSRFVIAGSILWLVLKAKGAANPTFKQWRAAALVGAIMLGGGNGLVSWSEQWVPSGIAALIVGTMPLWMVLLNWLLYGNERPTIAVILGLAIGFAGVALLAGNGGHEENGSNWGTIALLLACVFWAYGSLRSRRVDQGGSMLMASAMQMIGGGAFMLIVGAAIGEIPQIDFDSITAKSWWSFAYLIGAGSLIGFTSYVWLLSVASPTAVSTYAYVNPVVAVILGWWLGNEQITWRTVIAGAMVVGAVALMTLRRKRSVPVIPPQGSPATEVT